MPNSIKKPFGTSVKTWRNFLGISQEELAERAGLHRTYISDIERGARNVSLESIGRLARALEVSVPSLLSYSGTVPARNLVDILYVEDSEDDIELTLNALNAASITNRIHVVRDGETALEYLFGPANAIAPESLVTPRLILLDLGLPGINGLEVLRRVKSDPRTRRTPVIVLTSSRRDRDLGATKQLGADAYIVKPVDFQNLSEVTPKLSLHWALVKTPPTPGCEPVRQ